MHVTFEDTALHKEVKCNDKKIIGTRRVSTLTLLETEDLILEDSHEEETEASLFQLMWEWFLHLINRTCC
jgi:hypothetical protein